MIARRGKINIWAAGLSAAAHLVLLGGFAAVRLGASADPVSTSLGAVSMQTVKQTVSAPLVTPKPEIKPQIPPVSEPQPVEVVESKPEPMESTPAPSAAAESAPPVAQAVAETFEAEFFGQETVARTLCFVVDCSGSMYGRLELVERQLKDCIASLLDTQSFELILFMNGNRLLEMGEGKAIPATGFAKSRAFAMIDNIHLEGQANARQAIERAMKIRDTHGRPVELIYFLTDGFDVQMESSQAFCTDIAHMRRKYAPAVTINTIGLWTSLEDGKTLKRIADMTGGQYVPVPETQDKL